jgi:hypothetical protein
MRQTPTTREAKGGAGSETGNIDLGQAPRENGATGDRHKISAVSDALAAKKSEVTDESFVALL